MNTEKFKGAWTALITPFKKNGGIDYPALQHLIEIQIDAGITGITVLGTTGESPTIRKDEATTFIKAARKHIGGKCHLMIGCGTNFTESSVESAVKAEQSGADILLVITPYYNKPTQAGLFQHFMKISKAVKLPLIVYSIKGRTGVNIEPETLYKLISSSSNIVGVKEASGDINQITRIGKKKPRDFLLLSGDDNLTYRIIKESKGDGVISVASNIVPKQVVLLTGSALQGKFATSLKHNNELQALFKTLFIETNPIPVKYAAYKMKLCQLSYRLPLVPPSNKSKKIIDKLLRNYHLI